MTLTVHPRDLVAALDHVQHAAATVEDRPILNGILFEGDGDGFRLVAADNYRLAKCSMQVEYVEGEGEPFGRAVVRLDDIVAIRALLKGYTNSNSLIPLRIDRSPSGDITFSLSPYKSITVRPIDGTYPDYGFVFDQADKAERRTVTALNPDYLLGAAKGARRWETALRVSVAGPLDAVLITGDGDDYREAILPIRVGASFTDVTDA